MAAKPACARARVNLIVSICRSPKFYGASRKASVPDIYWTRAARNMKSLCFCGDETRQPSKRLSLLSVGFLNAFRHDKLCGRYVAAHHHARIFRRKRITAPIRFDLDASNRHHPQRTPSIVFTRRHFVLILSASSMTSDTALTLSPGSD